MPPCVVPLDGLPSLLPAALAASRLELPGGNSGDDLLLPGSLLAHATGFVAQELLVIVQIAVEGLDATLGDEPELVTYRAQQGPVVTDQQHCAFEFVECHA